MRKYWTVSFSQENEIGTFLNILIFNSNSRKIIKKKIPNIDLKSQISCWIGLHYMTITINIKFINIFEISFWLFIAVVNFSGTLKILHKYWFNTQLWRCLYRTNTYKLESLPLYYLYIYYILIHIIFSIQTLHKRCTILISRKGIPILIYRKYFMILQ